MITNLTGTQTRQLHEALLDAFPTADALHLLVRFELDQNLDFIVASTHLPRQVLELIDWARANNKLEQLIQGAQNTNPDNPKLAAFVAALGARPAPTGPPTVILPATAARDTFPKWRALLNDLASGQCTPILGPDLLEPLLGSSREMAHRWAQSYHYPLAPPAPEDLPQVAQYLATVENPNTLLIEFRRYLTDELLKRYAPLLPPAVRTASLDDLLGAAAAIRWDQDSANPYKILAGLPFPLYITANPDNLLGVALRAAGKQPETLLCRWLDDNRWPPSVYDSEPGYAPTDRRPLVYHLFGRFNLPISLVLKEDDYFDYLAGVARNSAQVPPVVREALADSALLFLGFRLDDWGFRVLFRSITGLGGSRRRRYTHVAVQLDPQNDSAPELTGARRYLESYFGSADITIYWGRVEAFLQDFQDHWARYQAGEET